MLLPSTHDTIVAVSSGWSASAVGILRLSGPDALEMAAKLVTSLFANRLGPEEWRGKRAGFREVELAVGAGAPLPATMFIFPAPRSYTGQDVVEIHTVGCLPILRELSRRLVDFGARRALPGEFTARAFRAGKLSVEQVDGVLSLIHAQTESIARTAARAARGSLKREAAEVAEKLTELLALVEAGIDFVDEEGISLVGSKQIRSVAESALAAIQQWRAAATRLCAGLAPHVALAGLPNAGKSTLFNALVGFERAIVSPVIGTTRDVISAEVRFNGVQAVLQDSAGLGASANELEAAAHLAAETAAAQADLVLWAHDSTRRFEDSEIRALDRIEPSRRLLVLTKRDASEGNFDPSMLATGCTFPAAVEVSARTGLGLDDLRRAVAGELARTEAAGIASLEQRPLADAAAALERIRELTDIEPLAAELIAQELRTALERLDPDRGPPDPDAVLGRIFGQFCIGK